jgi:PAS domain-containing protein
MFNKRLKQELAALREELSSVEQVRSSLDSEMLGMRLDPQGKIESVNGNFENEMHYRNAELVGRSIDDLVTRLCEEAGFLSAHEIRHQPRRASQRRAASDAGQRSGSLAALHRSARA